MKKQIALVIFIRTLFLSLILFGLNQIDPLGTQPAVLALAILVGVFSSSLLAFSRLSQRGFAVLCVILWGFFFASSWLATLIPFEGKSSVLAPYNFFLHGQMILIAFSAGAITTWGFWRLKDTPTVELLAILSGSIFALSGHRDFRLDNPQALSSLAWDLGVDQIYMFTILGVVVTAVTLLYLGLASLPVRKQLIGNWGDFSVISGRRSLLRSGLVALTVLLIFAAAFHYIYQFYHQISLTRLTNGVGESSQEGLSPLGFHSALGSTNQPAALVRLDGDYRENPFTPMLYLRENALSEYNGHEMVIADSRYDTDVAGNQPSEPYTGTEDSALSYRTPVTQSVYLLADHKLTMAIDYPVTIRPLKNPNPAKFKGSFRAYSVAPGFTPQTIATASVGDPRWSEETRQHYLKTTSDTRYHNLARELTSNSQGDQEKIQALLAYLSQRSIYTLTPNHQVEPSEDQTAPYLFGDMRGYCVHFAHATVYLLRSLGIPARIGTGYLTDLSQSKDGHILLRMSDRHAWAEVYITGIGWVPFDIQPAQVENHGDTQVDMKLLEDLMGLLEPGEEILPKDLTRDEPAFEEEWEFSFPLPSGRTVALITLGIFALLILSKLYLRYGWILTSRPGRRLTASYVALASLLVDLGYHRRRGETRDEYRRRLSAELGSDTLSLAEPLLRTIYAPPGKISTPLAEIDARRRNDLQTIKALPWHRRLLATLNPASLKRIISRSEW